MAIAFDTSATSSLANPATFVTWSHTTTTADDRIMFVAAGIPVSDKITGVTYNGVSLTKLEAFQLGDSRGVYLYYLVAPSTGTNNVTITGTSDAWKGHSATYTGVDQASPIDASTAQRSAASVTTYTANITTTADNCWLVAATRNGQNITTTGSAVVRQLGNGLHMTDSNAPVTPAGSTSLVFNFVSPDRIGVVMAAFKPVGAAAPAFTPRVIMY